MRLNREGQRSAWTGGRTNTAGMFNCSSGAGGVSASPEMSSRAHPCVCQRGTAGDQTRALWPNTGYLGLDHGSVISPRACLQKTSGSYLCFKLFVEFVTCKPGSSESCLAVDVCFGPFLSQCWADWASRAFDSLVTPMSPSLWILTKTISTGSGYSIYSFFLFPPLRLEWI